MSVGAWSIFWNEIQKELAKTTRVVTYDRAGYGWSDASPFPRTAKEIAEELHVLLHKANILPPYVPVGHSFGGHTIRVFADLYPEEVVGIVLVESAHERQWQVLPPAVNMLVEKALSDLKGASKLSRTGQMKLEEIEPSSSLPDGLQAAYKATIIQPKYHQAFYGEMAVLDLTSRQVAATKPLGNMPLAVVTAENSFGQFAGIPNFPIEECNQKWMELQSELTNLSSNSKLFLSKEATHKIQIDDPKIIIEAVSYVISSVRGN
ncbi:alpha/beta fold hydrolase [candidate division KSB1 bacterium]|nr:alpha/beta fold hydrolase [candidate division KSB1 bacterium]